MKELREATQRGRPCADRETILDYERRLNRILRPRVPGRPRKQELDPEHNQAAFGFAKSE